MRPNGNCPDSFAFNEECRSQITGDVHRVNCAAELSGKPVDFVRPQTRIEGICFEN